jgi:dUTP pyrophosphatase
MNDIGKFVNKSKFPQLTKKHEFDAGLDITSNEDTRVYPGGSTVVRTGLFLEIPKGYVGLIWSRSGLSVANKIEVGAGCIDSTYRGEVMVHLYNHGGLLLSIKKGDRIAQLLTIPCMITPYQEVTELTETDRGEKGFGSSDK